MFGESDPSIKDYLNQHNAYDPNPFVWTKSASEAGRRSLVRAKPWLRTCPCDALHKDALDGIERAIRDGLQGP